MRVWRKRQFNDRKILRQKRGYKAVVARQTPELRNHTSNSSHHRHCWTSTLIISPHPSRIPFPLLQS
jgi:hypothetical protein